MRYSIAQSRLDTAITLYDKGRYREALRELNEARKISGSEPSVEKAVTRYMAKCLAELKTGGRNA